MKYEIDDQTMNNLSSFLARVDLKGNEVPAFNRVLMALNQNNKKPVVKNEGEKKDDKPKKPEVQ